MTITEKMYALRRSPMFQGVDENELLLLAEVTQQRTYTPGTVVCRRGECPTRLFVPIAGRARYTESAAAAEVFDLPALLFDQPLEEDVVADDSEPLVCLTISKGYFFTLVNECPVVLLNMLRTVSSAGTAFAGGTAA